MKEFIKWVTRRLYQKQKVKKERPEIEVLAWKDNVRVVARRTWRFGNE
jgi:hypothetical protein